MPSAWPRFAWRVRRDGRQNRQYAELHEIYEELEQTAALHRRLGCPVIDVTGLSIERPLTGSCVSSTGGGRRRMRPKPPVPLWRWAVWWTILGTAVVVFYVPAHPALARSPRRGLGGGVALETAESRTERLTARGHRLEQVALRSTRLSTAAMVNLPGSSRGVSSSQRSGVETGAPSFGRTEYTDAIVFPRRSGGSR